jgi:hypothetical protein
MCRLDFFLISTCLKSKVKECGIYHGLKSDHSLVTLNLNCNKSKHGKGMWKFNTSLLQDIEYTNLVRNVIEEICKNNSEAHPDILWETLKCVIRGETIKYASQKYKNMSETEKKSLKVKLSVLSMILLLILVTFSGMRLRLKRIALN